MANEQVGVTRAVNVGANEGVLLSSGDQPVGPSVQENRADGAIVTVDTVVQKTAKIVFSDTDFKLTLQEDGSVLVELA
jgi:hypothetical protein